MHRKLCLSAGLGTVPLDEMKKVVGINEGWDGWMDGWIYLYLNILKEESFS